MHNRPVAFRITATNNQVAPLRRHRVGDELPDRTHRIDDGGTRRIGHELGKRLDRASAIQVMDLIAEINREEGTTFLISTHDEKIAALCRRQIVVGDGVVTG